MRQLVNDQEVHSLEGTFAHLLLKSKGEKHDAPHLQHCYLKLSFY